MLPEPGLDQAAEPLFDSARHRPLKAPGWSEDRARSAIAGIVADFVARGDPDTGWPTHPLDATTSKPRWCSYNGAAGAIAALRILRSGGIDAPDLTAWLQRFHHAWRAAPDEGPESGLQLGETGLLLPDALSNPKHHGSRLRVERAIATTVGHPAREITSGETGAMHAAMALFRATKQDRWRRLWQRCAGSLLESWHQRPESDQWLWRNEIFGSVRGYYGACHGVAGNAGALIEGEPWLGETVVGRILERTITTLERGALRSGPYLNWPVSADPSGTRRLVQWCHGAAGVVTALAGARVRDPSWRARLDTLLVGAGELVWKAGPLAKGSGLCHGTAGNGYALLLLHRRTGSPVWLDRARAFAMHAIGQCERARERYRQGRFTLWTGDGGLAIYLDHCIDPRRAAFPGLTLS